MYTYVYVCIYIYIERERDREREREMSSSAPANRQAGLIEDMALALAVRIQVIYSHPWSYP